MPKATMKFDLPEEFHEFQYATRGKDWMSVVDDMATWLKRKMDEPTMAASHFSKAHDMLFEIQSDYGLSVHVDGGEVSQEKKEPESFLCNHCGVFHPSGYYHQKEEGCEAVTAEVSGGAFGPQPALKSEPDSIYNVNGQTDLVCRQDGVHSAAGPLPPKEVITFCHGFHCVPQETMEANRKLLEEAKELADPDHIGFDDDKGRRHIIVGLLARIKI